jgi:hypothetical protein
MKRSLLYKLLHGSNRGKLSRSMFLIDPKTPSFFAWWSQM